MQYHVVLGSSSSRGWLLTADGRAQLCLVNPVTGERRALPAIDTIPCLFFFAGDTIPCLDAHYGRKYFTFYKMWFLRVPPPYPYGTMTLRAEEMCHSVGPVGTRVPRPICLRPRKRHLAQPEGAAQPRASPSARPLARAGASRGPLLTRARLVEDCVRLQAASRGPLRRRPPREAPRCGTAVRRCPRGCAPATWETYPHKTTTARAVPAGAARRFPLW